MPAITRFNRRALNCSRLHGNTNSRQAVHHTMSMFSRKGRFQVIHHGHISLTLYHTTTDNPTPNACNPSLKTQPHRARQLCRFGKGPHIPPANRPKTEKPRGRRYPYLNSGTPSPVTNPPREGREQRRRKSHRRFAATSLADSQSANPARGKRQSADRDLCRVCSKPYQPPNIRPREG